MPTLHDRFADLAEDAPDSATPPGIWDEGRRRARVRRAGAAVVVAVTVAALVSVGLAATRRASSPTFTDRRGSGPALPTVIHSPSRWLSDTGGRPPGPLSVAIPAKRGTWTGYHWSVVGVSATTGAYHFLDLPDYGSAGALSPDGRHLAYWTGAGSGHSRHLVGLAVYDTVTGRVHRWRPPSGERLHPNGLAWYGNEALTFPENRSTGLLWRFGHGAPHPLIANLTTEVGQAGSAGLYALGARRFFYLDPHDPARVRFVTVANPPRTMSYPRAVSPSGRRIAVVDADQLGSRLYVGTVQGKDGHARLSRVATSLRWPTLQGWTDDRHLVVVAQVSPRGYDAEGAAGVRYALEKLDVTTGHSVLLADLGSLGNGGVDIAAGLLGGPTRDFPAPPSPMDPRLEVGLLVVIVVAGTTSLLVWRRRAHG